MDDLFGEMECRYRLDSIMMSLLRAAMDNAHERVQSKDGPIECLHERSKFYELAIIQIEGSLKLIQEEADNPRVPEISREKMMADLTDLKHLLRMRLKDMKNCIVEKDKELLERLENEFRLRQALELKEHELHSLRSKLKDEEGKADFELKNYEDQQVFHVKEGVDFKEIDFHTKIKSMDVWLKAEREKGVEEKSSDIDILKGTLELAFGRMQNAEVRPLEKKWRWSIEEDIVSILIKGFINELEQNFETELKERDSSSTFVLGMITKEDFLKMTDEMIILKGELEEIWYKNGVEEKHIKGDSEMDEEGKHGNPQQMRRTSSAPMPFMDYTLPEEGLDDTSEGNYVAKMIKSHESIIKKQREEINWLKLKEALRKKDGGPSAKREKELDGLERTVQEIIVKLENVSKWKDKLQEKGSLQENMKNHYDAILKVEIESLKREIEHSNLLRFSLEEHYIVLLKGLLNDFYVDFYTYDMERSIWEDIHVQYFKEMVNEFNLSFANGFVDQKIEGELYCVVFNEVVKNFISKISARFLKNQNGAKKGENEECYLESSLREDLYAVFLREVENEWKMEKYVFEMENTFREEIYQLVIVETIKDGANNQYYSTDDFNYPMKLDEISDITGGESFIQELDTLLEFFEVEEELTVRPESPKAKEPKLHNIRTLDWLMHEEETCFSPVSDKLEKALEQLGATKELLRELEDQITPKVGFIPEKQGFSDSFSLDYALIPLVEFQQVITDFENNVQDLLHTGCLRLAQVKQQVNNLVQLADLLRKRELLYKNAFLRRCHNLRLAEIEVDLLGDQVDGLVGLLGKIYLILNQHSSELSRYFDVCGILKQIKEGVSGVAVQCDMDS